MSQTRLEEDLRKLNKNYNILKEREAKFAGSAPLDLLNQIEDHKLAIGLTEQVLAGAISESEWGEALEPLLFAIRDGQVVDITLKPDADIAPPAQVARDMMVTGDIHGGYVAIGQGAQVIVQQVPYHLPPPPLPLTQAKERRELSILLNKVKAFWIEGVLKKSVHKMAMIDLGKETQSDAVAHAWDQVLELPDQSRQTLPPDKNISHIFDEMNRALLILGEPGTGKTITLLQLAQDLIERVEQDESFIEPVPVVFNLSTWSQGQTLIEWLVAELSSKYQIPKRMGQPWLEQHRILPLLDGLDEVNPADRAACVEAINTFGQEFGLSGLAVCSRVTDYTALPVRLKLNGAIRLQPLSLEQVDDYLEAAGEQLTVLRTALEVDEELQSLAQTPLTLGIMVLAYQDLPVEGLVGQAQQSLEARRRHLFETYIERMFRRKGQGDERYRVDQTKNRLAWLGQQMRRHNQSIFLIEQLQPSWLVSRGWTWAYLLASRIIAELAVGLIMGLTLGVSAARFFRMTDTLAVGLGGWLGFGLILGLVLGLLLALLDGLGYHRPLENGAGAADLTRQQRGLKMVGYGLVIGLGAGAVSWLFAAPWLALFMGSFVGVETVLFIGLYSGWESLSQDVITSEALDWSWRRSLKSVPFGLAWGLVVGLILVWVYAQNQALQEGLLSGPIAKLLGEGLFVIGGGVFYSLFWGVVVALFGGLGSQLVEAKIKPNEGMHLTLRNSLLVGPVFGLIIMLIGWLIFVPLYGWQNGLDIGVSWGLTIGILAWGWYGGTAVIGHGTLRVLLWLQAQLPLNPTHFLDYAAEQVFLQKVGGGYIFIHRLLLEHFAEMESQQR